MRKFYFCLVFLVFVFGNAFSEIKFLKYYISILGIRAGEVSINFSYESNVILSHSIIKTYPGILISVNMDTKSYIDAELLRTIKMYTVSTGMSFKDTNVVIFDRENKNVVIDSQVFGKIYVNDTNNTANDLSVQIYKSTKWTSLPQEFSINFVETTNTKMLTFSLSEKMRYTIREVKDGYIEFTNINGSFVFYKANVPIFYLFPFGNISFYLELSKYSFSEK